MNKRSKILILHCGALSEHGIKDLGRWIDEMAELTILADTEVKFFSSAETSDITPDTWISLANEIHKHYHEFDGFVVLHGLDNILFTASALSFLLQNLAKPVIFTGGHLFAPSSKKPFFGSGREVGIKANIINAVQAATLSFGEVALMFGNRLIRANQAYRTYSAGVNFFEAPETGILGQIDFSIRLFEKNILKSKGQVVFSDRLETRIAQYKVTPGFATAHIEEAMKDARAVIFDFGYLETAPERLNQLITRLAKETIVAVNYQSEHLAPFSDDQVITLAKMTFEAGYTKLMFALGQNKNHREIKKFILKNVAGEML